MKKVLILSTFFSYIFCTEFVYAPWRDTYIKDSQENHTCPFCDQFRFANDDKKNLILKRLDSFVIIMNLHPYCRGHLMIIPLRHIKDLHELTQSEKAEFLDIASKVVLILGNFYKIKDFNVGFNIGKPAGASVCDHLHLHIVPRVSVNLGFVDFLFDQRVITYDLSKEYENLCKYFDSF